MESVLQKNYDNKIERKQLIALACYSLALAIIVSWMGFCSFDEFKRLGSNGIPKTRLAGLPKALIYFYKGFPNKSTLLCYVLLTLSGFMTLGHKNLLLRAVNISSFALLFWLLFLLS